MAQDPENEAACRMRIDAILVECIGLEQDRAKQNREYAMALISLAAETSLQLDVILKGKKRVVSGRADYTLWYDDHSLGTNLIIIEAKKQGAYSEGFCQCLGYMGR
jgi:hypothetical protein